MAPLERIKLECIIQGSRFNWIDATQWIWEKEGLVGFWRGNLLNLFRMVPFKSINFICYDMYCDHLLRSQGKSQLSSQERLIGGGVAGVAATILCIPLDTVSNHCFNILFLPVHCNLFCKDLWLNNVIYMMLLRCRSEQDWLHREGKH